MGDIKLEDSRYEAATRRGEGERANMPVPAAVRFDERTARLIVEFTNGAALLVPARALQGLEDATDAELAEVELAGETGLHWPSRDIDFTIAGLMQGIFGTAQFMAGQRKGGQSRSAAKVAASRANGAKGGRPRKASLS
ncbi:hypothetical protein ASD04_16875 [Devosia sp. Root436]|uniref:DUF2442 domain-containing protein n=1 Tax=Devosia sp. Root436 TaxID=1736537 RepID=UPI0006FF89B0|nr:DUF2442 domain-containing protein [Devosia sp. Root436]KQX34312.1 hypothetical protein ASD04_16875 [Devosia sp. Root436]